MTHAPKNILVVGGAGFIGSYVNLLLHRSGYQTVILDNLSSGRQEMVQHGTFIQGDIGDSDLLKHIFSKHSIDAVMHFAAFINVGESMQSPNTYYQNNVVKTLTLLNAMVEQKINTFVFSSSAAVYGLPQKKPLTETHPCQPINPYGRTKWIVEQILSDYDRAYGLKSSCLRYFNAAGGDPEGILKNTKPQESNLIPVILHCLLKHKTLTINGTDYPTSDGTCIRDYIHIHDLATAHIKAMNQLWQKKRSTIYNLGTGQGHSIREVIASIEKTTKLKVKSVEGPRRAGDPPVLVACADLAHQALDWQPQYSLEDIVAHAWQSMKD